jgi:hypothetical protein
MRRLILIALVLVVGAGCPSRKPADQQRAPLPPPPAPLPSAPAAVDAKPAPARTELDRSPGVVIEAPNRPELVEGAYVWPCPLMGLEEAEVAISRNRRLSLSHGSRLLSVLKLDDDFYAAETDVTCQKRSVAVRREKDGRYREAGFNWDEKRLVKTARAEGLIPAPPGP